MISACFTACIEGIDAACLFPTDRSMWQALRALIKAPDTVTRLQIVAKTRHLTFLRWILNGQEDEITSLPDLAELRAAVRARVEQIALTDPDPAKRSFIVGDATLSPVLSFEDLDQIARRDPDPGVRAEAGRTLGWIRAQIGTAAERKGIATSSKDPEVRRQAVGFLTDEAALAEIALEDPDETVREEAVGRLDDQKLLARIAEKDKDDGVRLTATVGLTDQKALERLARRARTAEVRETAVSKVTRQAVIAEVARDDSDPDVRFAAVKKLSDPSALAAVARSEGIAEIRGAAIAKLTDPAQLLEIALHDKDAWAFEAAIDRIPDQGSLRQIVERRIAEPKVVQHVARRLEDQATLAMILRRSKDDLSRRIAAARLTDAALAAEALAAQGSAGVREILVGQVKDPEVLARVAATDPDERVRMAASKRLEELGRDSERP